MTNENDLCDFYGVFDSNNAYVTPMMLISVPFENTLLNKSDNVLSQEEYDIALETAKQIEGSAE